MGLNPSVKYFGRRSRTEKHASFLMTEQYTGGCEYGKPEREGNHKLVGDTSRMTYGTSTPKLSTATPDIKNNT